MLVLCRPQIRPYGCSEKNPRRKLRNENGVGLQTEITKNPMEVKEENETEKPETSSDQLIKTERVPRRSSFLKEQEFLKYEELKQES